MQDQDQAQDQEPENVVEFKAPEPEPKAPVFVLPIPMPRPTHIQDILDEFDLMPAEKKIKVVKDLEEFYGQFYFAAAAAGTAPDPELSEDLKDLFGSTRVVVVKGERLKVGIALQSIFHSVIPRDFKAYHFNRGFKSLPEETQKEIVAMQRKAREEAQVYAHLPEEGATLPDGTKATVEQLRDMVDKGWLPPNPALGIKAREPDVDATKAIVSINKPTEIIKP
jgi:hypothetical protein